METKSLQMDLKSLGFTLSLNKAKIRKRMEDKELATSVLVIRKVKPEVSAIISLSIQRPKK